MGKFNEYTQKATPADNDTLMIYDAAAKANKLSPFSGIWNWIVGKLTNAVISNLRTNNQTMIGAINELKSNTHLGTLNDNIAEYLSKTNGTATTYFVWGNIGGLYPSWAWGTLLCSNDNTANFIGIANSNKVAAFAHYENGAWEKVPVESLSNLTTTNKSSLVGAINEVNSKNNKVYSTNFDTRTLETIEINLGGTADAAAEILLMDKYRMFFVHAYSADGKTIGEIVTKSIYGDNVTPATNNTIISIHVGSWDSGTAIISYTQERPSLSIK